MHSHNGKPITNCQTQLNKLKSLFDQTTETAIGATNTDTGSTQTLSDLEVLDRASNASNRQKFLDLWNGIFESYYQRSDGTGDQSRADFALIAMLAFFSRDFAQIKRLFLQSALGKRKKAHRDNYVDPMIRKALSDYLPMVPGQFYGFLKQIENVDVQTYSRSSNDNWPVLHADALYGIPGRFVRSIEPHSEADPVAILLQLLTATGCLFGRNAFFRVESTNHYPNLFGLIVGNTAKARKGTSWGWIRELVKLVDPDWFSSNCKGGLVSGEGLVYHVRDPIRELVEVRGYVKTAEPRYKTVDPGVKDKRLLVVEPEFASVLGSGKRDGNTLFDFLRIGWDSNEILQTLAKNSPVKATGAQIALIAHITAQEFTRCLSVNNQFNGFGNRFLIACVKRSKLMPIGSDINPIDLLQSFVDPIRVAINHAAVAGAIGFAHDAKPIWISMYRQLSEEHPGSVGAMTARGEAQIIRIALIYALLDCSQVIEVAHLNAAKAVWGYCEKSVELLFGRSTGDSLADRIFDCIVKSGATGMSRTDISNALNRNKSKSQIDHAINVLVSAQRIRVEVICKHTNRSEQRYFAINQ